MDTNAIEKLKDRHKNSFQMWFYAIQRIDLLIISISGAGVYVVLETFKFASANHIQIELGALKVSGVFFVSAIIMNFISQFTGKKANDHDLKWCAAQISSEIKLSKKQKDAISRNDKLAEKYTKWTDRLNLTSMILMFIGLAAVMYYFLVNDF